MFRPRMFEQRLGAASKGRGGNGRGTRIDLSHRVPSKFIDAMKRISESDKAANTEPAQKSAVEPSGNKWNKSSFKPLGNEEDDAQERNTGNAEKANLYDPYDQMSSDSEDETSQDRHGITSPAFRARNLDRQRLSTVRSSCDSKHWNCSEAGSETLNRHHPDRLSHGSSSQRFPASYGQRTNSEEKITVPEYMRENIRLSPPRPKDFQQPLAYLDKAPKEGERKEGGEQGRGQQQMSRWPGLDPGSSRVQPLSPHGLDDDLSTIRNRNKEIKVKLKKAPISCDLCDLMLSNGQELYGHLDSKCHWDTLEYIQKNTEFDDLAIAFLQEVMLFKAQHCSQAIEGSALEALQEDHHLTKVEVFYCSACKTYISASTAEVQAHITSHQHLSGSKDFEALQTRVCLGKAKTMMKELKPQFEHFVK
ncbi:uncharacterized protein KZ484_021777 isoform 3-T3 [Pholidichthys leucotaenia]